MAEPLDVRKCIRRRHTPCRWLDRNPDLRLGAKKNGRAAQRSATKIHESHGPNTHYIHWIHLLIRPLARQRSLELLCLCFKDVPDIFTHRAPHQSCVCACSLGMTSMARMCVGQVRLNRMFRPRMDVYDR